MLVSDLILWFDFPVPRSSLHDALQPVVGVVRQVQAGAAASRDRGRARHHLRQLQQLQS